MNLMSRPAHILVTLLAVRLQVPSSECLVGMAWTIFLMLSIVLHTLMNWEARILFALYFILTSNGLGYPDNIWHCNYQNAATKLAAKTPTGHYCVKQRKWFTKALLTFKSFQFLIDGPDGTLCVTAGGAGPVRAQQGGHAEPPPGEEVANLDLAARRGGAARHGALQQPRDIHPPVHPL